LLQNSVLITIADGSHKGRVFTSVYLCVCLLFHTISQKPKRLGSPNLMWKCSKMSSGNPFILWSKVKIMTYKHIAGVGLCTLVSAGFV